ncbi:hypothetical protein [Methylovorus mays]|uniref:hypothetical protein n=1 Tax=Methylovorus mays TaxID=184077 RepID=UPI001E4859A3|nr:hypothetical protein [Methylovorus mays]MCB5206348.1 hypothetical protein [Methylovorus mays]
MHNYGESEFSLLVRRIRRNHEDSLIGYDPAIILDLIGNLRVLSEMTDILGKAEPSFAFPNHFKTAKPSKQVVKLLRGKKFLIAFMPDGLITSAANNFDLFFSAPYHPEGTATVEAAFRVNSNGSREFKNFIYVKDFDLQPLSSVASQVQITSCNFYIWLHSEVIKISIPDKDNIFTIHSLSRIDLIKRISVNGAVHPKQKATDSYDRPKDELISNLFLYEFAGLPLHYFLLLKISQDVLRASNKAIPST